MFTDTGYGQLRSVLIVFTLFIPVSDFNVSLSGVLCTTSVPFGGAPQVNFCIQTSLPNLAYEKVES